MEWADKNYYLPKESAYQEGRWVTLPFQRAIMNAMGNDYIREVNVVKSARVGYSKMLLGVYSYFIEHKQRNSLIWLPTDGDAENFMKSHVEPTIRDIPALLALAPWYGKKHRNNTLSMKRFSNGRGFWCLGGKAAKNYREKSVDVAGYDELAAFDEDIEKEGSPTFLGDKRIEGSVWPKSIRGSTPKIRGTCQIERAASESQHFMRFHVACPHCGEEQYLKFGDRETPFGFKWSPGEPASVFYLCEHNGCVIKQQELDFTHARYICERTGNGDKSNLAFGVDGNGAYMQQAMARNLVIDFAQISDNIRSTNYQPGVAGAGWSISKNGGAEFNNITARGRIFATDGEFNGVVRARDGSFRGTIDATDGTFRGTVQASRFIGDICSAGVFKDGVRPDITHYDSGNMGAKTYVVSAVVACDINFTGQIYVWIKGQRVGKYSVGKAASNSTTRYIPVTGTLSGITDQNVRCEITVDGGGIYNFMGGFALMTRSSGSWA